MMRRGANPMNATMAASTTAFRLRDVRGAGFALAEPERSALAQVDGFVETRPAETVLAVSHQHSDAFGLLYLVRNFDLTLPEGHPETERGSAVFSLAGCTVRHAWRPRRAGDAQQRVTPAQQFVGEALDAAKASGFTGRAAVTVALESPEAITLAEVWGNSFTLAPFTCDELRPLADAGAFQWWGALRDRARRVEKVLARGAKGRDATPDTLVFSLLGDLAQLSWAPRVHPAVLCGFSTPTSPSSAHLFSWSAGSTEVLTVVAPEGSALDGALAPWTAAWRQA